MNFLEAAALRGDIVPSLFLTLRPKHLFTNKLVCLARVMCLYIECFKKYLPQHENCNLLKKNYVIYQKCFQRYSLNFQLFFTYNCYLTILWLSWCQQHICKNWNYWVLLRKFIYHWDKEQSKSKLWETKGELQMLCLNNFWS